MLTLHYYSNCIGVRLETIEEEEEYSIDEIKEFEAVDPAWQEALNALLQGISINNEPDDDYCPRMTFPNCEARSRTLGHKKLHSPNTCSYGI